MVSVDSSYTTSCQLAVEIYRHGTVFCCLEYGSIFIRFCIASSGKSHL